MAQGRKPPFTIPEWMLRLLFTHQWREKQCLHLKQIAVRDTDVTVCPDCVKLGDDWPSLRMCLICGYVGCCDTSKNKHMKQHVDETGHPIVRSIDHNEAWIWCYEDDAFISSRSPQLDQPLR